jgi:hypothetical protein
MLLGCLVLGADVGWRPLSSGDGMEYLIQLSPKDLEAIRSGEAWMTDIPAAVGDVRAYRITVGTEALPRIDPPPSLPSLAADSPDDQPDGQPAPHPIRPEPGAKPLPEQQAVHMTPRPVEDDASSGNGTAAGDGSSPDSAGQDEATPERPWMLLVGTALALAGSLGGNAYLLWALREAYQRCRRMSEATGAPDALA